MKVLKVTVTTEWVDEETGEITKDVREFSDDSVKKPRSSSKATAKIEENPDPILTLESNKYSLTTGAVQLLGIEAGDKLDIKFQKIDKTIIPVIGSNDVFGTKGGNKLTKSNTVSYRGKYNEELSEYGSEFQLVKHPTADGLFVLKSTCETEVKETGAKPEEEDDVEDLDDLIGTDETDDAITISDDDFKL